MSADNLIKSKQIKSLEVGKVEGLVLFQREIVDEVIDNKMTIKGVALEEMTEEIFIKIQGISYSKSCFEVEGLEITWTFDEASGGFDLDNTMEIELNIGVERTKKQARGMIGGNVEAALIPSKEGIDIGTPEKKFRAMYVREMYLDANTLYIDGVPVLGTNADNIVFSADPDQGIVVKTTGVGASKVISENHVEVSTSGIGSNVDIKSTGSSSKVNISSAEQVAISAPLVTVTGETVATNVTTQDLLVKGNLKVQGSNTVIDSTNLAVEDNIIELNKGETGNGVSLGKAGIKINRGDGLPYFIVFDEATGKMFVGEQGKEEALATEEWVLSKFDELPAGSTTISVKDVDIQGNILRLTYTDEKTKDITLPNMGGGSGYTEMVLSSREW